MDHWDLDEGGPAGTRASRTHRDRENSVQAGLWSSPSSGVTVVEAPAGLWRVFLEAPHPSLGLGPRPPRDRRHEQVTGEEPLAPVDAAPD